MNYLVKGAIALALLALAALILYLTDKHARQKDRLAGHFHCVRCGNLYPLGEEYAPETNICVGCTHPSRRYD